MLNEWIVAVCVRLTRVVCSLREDLLKLLEDNRQGMENLVLTHTYIHSRARTHAHTEQLLV